MHVLATRPELLAEGSADGALWSVHREGDVLVAVVESPAGRSEFHGRELAPRGPVGVGRCGSALAGRWWSLTLGSAVRALWLGADDRPLVLVALPAAAHRGRRHLLHPAGDVLCWRAETSGGTVTGRTCF